MEEVSFDMKDRAYDDQYLERDLNGQLIRLYIVKQVPLETKFAPKTKNEIKVKNPAPVLDTTGMCVHCSTAGSLLVGNALVSHC